jgi:hypothetical protein
MLYEIKVPEIVQSTLQLDAAECRAVYGIQCVDQDHFVAPHAGWRKAIDDLRHFGWELPESVIESWVAQVEDNLSVKWGAV